MNIYIYIIIYTEYYYYWCGSLAQDKLKAAHLYITSTIDDAWFFCMSCHAWWHWWTNQIEKQFNRFASALVYTSAAICPALVATYINVYVIIGRQKERRSWVASVLLGIFHAGRAAPCSSCVARGNRYDRASIDPSIRSVCLPTDDSDLMIPNSSMYILC